MNWRTDENWERSRDERRELRPLRQWFAVLWPWAVVGIVAGGIWWWWG
jgi:hypothetical protein